ncbi:hypothetical protein [Streptomyces hydrogenans]|uniref:hypothetical protein n=1 Tax=Streptomyces hydrogenans TaxID=1873719 RepID=UPI0035D6BE8A
MSTRTGRSELSDADLMRLGEKILHEMDANETGDTLTRWMAHHITSLMETADRALKTGTPEEAAHATEECRRAVLDLWAHRTAWPSGWPPPGAKRMAEVLNQVATPTHGVRQDNGLSTLENLHHQILTALFDEATADEPIDAVQDWLESFFDLLDADERTLMDFYAGRSDRAATAAETPQAEPSNDDSGEDGESGLTPQGRRALDLAQRYLETVRLLLTEGTKDTPTQPS